MLVFCGDTIIVPSLAMFPSIWLVPRSMKIMSPDPSLTSIFSNTFFLGAGVMLFMYAPLVFQDDLNNVS